MQTKTQSLSLSLLEVATGTFTYTLISYRPDGIDTCRGCVMGTSSSDFDLKIFRDRDDLVAAWAKAAADAPDDREYSDTEFTLLLNGLDSDHDYHEHLPSDERVQIHALVEAETKRLKAVKLEVQLDAEKKARRAAEDRVEAGERKQLADLQKKYGGSP